ncbi:MAG: type I restriction endonuclease [Methylococcales bacterium]
MSIEKHIEEIRTAIKAGHFINEASVSQGIVLRLLQALEWSIYEPQVVCPEYQLQGRRVDYALCHPTSKPIAFIEVKKIGQSEGAEKQLFEYAFHVGIPLAILTDGQEWNFFLPAEQGSYDERRVYKLDIMQRDLSECAARLTRYLHYDAVASGEAIKAAREDYRNVARDRQIEVTLPLAWTRLISEEDEELLELVAERVESLCGFKPDLKTVAEYLKSGGNITTPTPNTEKPPVTGSNKNKIGEFAQSILRKMFANNEVSQEEVELMQTKEYSKKTFHLDHPLLLKVSLLTIDTKKRYWTRNGDIEIYGEKYLICSQWFEVSTNNDRPYFEKWLALKTSNVFSFTS